MSTITRVLAYLHTLRSHLVLVAVIVALALVGVWRLSVRVPDLPPLLISSPINNVTTIKVPEPVLTIETVKELVKVVDRAQVESLMAENRQLKIKVEELSVTNASGTSSGSGTATVEPIPGPDHIVPNLPPVRVAFEDWRLKFVAVDNKVDYTLSQKFSIVATTGTDKKGRPTQLVRLYEVGPGDTRTQLSTVDTTTIVGDANAPHWVFKPTIQAGLGVTQTIPAGSQNTVGVVAVPLLKHGTSSATEDTKYAVLVPTATFSATEKTLGVMPFSYNLGTLPHQPLTNVWVGPYIGQTISGSKRLGFLLTATF